MFEFGRVRETEGQAAKVKASGGDTVMTEDGKFYRVDGSKVTLSPEAREMARMAGLSDTEMARHLIAQDKLRSAGTVQRQGED